MSKQPNWFEPSTIAEPWTFSGTTARSTRVAARAARYCGVCPTCGRRYVAGQQVVEIARGDLRHPACVR